jgi:hypothetical protein
MRGPLARANPLTGGPVPVQGRMRPAQLFVSCVEDAVSRIERQYPAALRNVDVGIADVPDFEPHWAGDRALLAAAIEPPTPGARAQVVVYRRPLERRAESRTDLRRLVYRTVVEQLSALTGLPIETIDPFGDARPDEDG